jgi:hypothetical protein
MTDAAVVEKPVTASTPAPAKEKTQIEYALAAQIVAGLLGGPNTSPKDVAATVATAVVYALAIVDAVDKANI